MRRRLNAKQLQKVIREMAREQISKTRKPLKEVKPGPGEHYWTLHGPGGTINKDFASEEEAIAHAGADYDPERYRTMRVKMHEPEASVFRKSFDEDDLVHIRAFLNLETDDMPEHVWDKLYSYYEEDMPYGTQKARTGEPQVWIADRLEADKEDLGL